jgi:hypothetical protein
VWFLGFEILKYLGMDVGAKEVERSSPWKPTQMVFSFSLLRNSVGRKEILAYINANAFVDEHLSSSYLNHNDEMMRPAYRILPRLYCIQTACSLDFTLNERIRCCGRD